MATKKPEEIRKKKNPDGSVEVQYTDGTAIRTNPDGSKDFIDASGKSLTKLSITDAQIEAWKKAPKEEALKEALKLFREQDMDVSEARMKLEVLKFISELQGAHVPVTNTQNIVAIEIHVADLPPGMKVIDVTPVHREQ